jgi:hypothetical protein
MWSSVRDVRAEREGRVVLRGVEDRSLFGREGLEYEKGEEKRHLQEKKGRGKG